MKKIASFFCYLFDRHDERIVFRYVLYRTEKRKFKYHIDKGLASSNQNSFHGDYLNLPTGIKEVFIDLWHKEKTNGLYGNTEFVITRINERIPKIIDEISAGKISFTIVGNPSKYLRNYGNVSRETYDILLEDFFS